jgi:hypothetical protein
MHAATSALTTAPTESVAHAEGHATPTPSAAPVATTTIAPIPKKSGVVDVLFSDFIIQ